MPRDTLDNGSKEEILNLGSILSKYITEKDIEEKLKKFSIFNHWQEIVGKEIGSKTKPQKIFKGVLYILVTSPTWANELNMMSRLLIEKINRYIGKPAIKDLRFRLN